MKVLMAVFGFILLLSAARPVTADVGAGTLSIELSRVFAFFFLTLGPGSVIAPFARGTVGLDDETRRRVALATMGVAFFCVLVAATIGVSVLSRWGISTGALLIAAGIILFLVALQSIRSQYGTPQEQPLPDPATQSTRRLAFQMAIPYIVSPYGVAIVILVLTTRPDSVPLAPILAMLAAIMLLNGLAMLLAHRIARSAYLVPVLVIVSSVLAVLQAALGIQAILAGLELAGVT